MLLPFGIPVGFGLAGFPAGARIFARATG